MYGTVYSQGLREISSSPKHPLGFKWVLEDGRQFVYAKAGASALAVGTLLQAPAPAANHLNKAVKAAAAIGAKTVKVAIGATALTADQYKDGYLHINDATGEGYNYKVKNHLAYSASGAACYINLADDDPIRVALVASTSEYTLTKNPYDGVIVTPLALTAPVVGVAPGVVTAAYYFWMQTKGPCPVLTHSTVVVGNGVIPNTTASTATGQVLAEAAGSITERVGVVMQVNASTEYSLINLNIPSY